MPDRLRPSPGTDANGKGRVLVVGTTPDYVELLRSQHPRRCLFLTESGLRQRAVEPQPGEEEEVLFRWEEQQSAFEALRQHGDRHEIHIEGVACFDCESMPLASLIAARLGLPYPLSEAVARCRNKAEMRRCWQATGTPCPRSVDARGPDEAVRFFRENNGPCVLKPLTGSGSELVFRVDNEAECRRAFGQIVAGVAARRGDPLYRLCEKEPPSVQVEECVAGDEFSCDFLIDAGLVQILRVARKHPRRGGPFGTIGAYEIETDRHPPCQDSRLGPDLLRAATALGIDRGICMVDFIVRDGRPVFLELTPRCGGDCLPSLLRIACGLDVLGLALRFSAGSVASPVTRAVEPAVALRLFADACGTLEQADATALAADPRVVCVELTKKPGSQVRLPPADYDSWVLGHVVYLPDRSRGIAEQNEELASLFRTRIAP